MLRKLCGALTISIVVVLLTASPASAGIVSGLPQSSSVRLDGGGIHRASYRISDEYTVSSSILGRDLVLKGAVRDYAADSRKSCVDIEVNYTWDPAWERRQTRCDDFNPQGATNFTVRFAVEQSFPTGTESREVVGFRG